MTKKILGIITIMAVLASTVACGSQSADKEPVVLNTVSMFGGDNSSAQYYHEIIKEYETKYRVTVNDDSQASSEVWKTSVTTSFQIENEPDVLFYFTGSEAASILELNAFVDIDTIKSEYPEYGENINASAMEFMVEDDGHTYALPVRGFWEGLYVNEDLFDEYNLELPTTWDNFIKAIEVFAQTDIVPIAVSFSDEPHYWIEHLIMSYGGIEEHCKNLTSNDIPESWIEGLSLFQDLNNLGAFAENATSTTADAVKQLFVEKKAAMLIEGSWYLENIEDKETTTVISFPNYSSNQEGTTNIIGGFSSGFYISKKAWEDPQKREAAVRFVEEMTSNESIEKFAREGGAPAANIELQIELSAVQVDGTEMAAKADNIEMPIDSRIDKLSWTYIVAGISNLIEGTSDAESILKNAAYLNK